MMRLKHDIGIYLHVMWTLAELVSSYKKGRCYSNIGNSGKFHIAYSDCSTEIDELEKGPFYDDFLNNPSDEKLVKLCGVYQRWLECLHDLARACDMSDEEAEADMNKSQRLIIKTCMDRREITFHNLDCLVTQSRSSNPLYKGCYTMIDLKYKSKIYDTCSLAQEYVSCEDRLMRSACGSHLADFTLALSVKSKSPVISASLDWCDVRIVSSFTGNQYVKGYFFHIPNSTVHREGFTYSMNCPPDFPVRMRNCYSIFERTKMALYTSMLAVIRGSASKLDEWCDGYYDYEECMQPIVRTCPEGVHRVYEVENEWHKLVEIANYQCNSALTDYKRYLPCYKKMIRYSSIFDLCKSMHDTYPPIFEAYQMKCTSALPESSDNLRKRDNLIDCFTSFIERDCGLNGSLIIAPIIRMQYSFDYLPPCSNQVQVRACASRITGNKGPRHRSHNFLFTTSSIVLPLLAFIRR